DWRLVLAGSQGFGAEETLTEIRQSPARERIYVTGYVTEEEAGAWFAKAGIFAFPSLDEGFGIPILEAMAAGVPVLTGNRSALPEVAANAGLCVDAMDEQALADGLVRLAFDGELRENLIQRGRTRAAEFTWDRAVSQTLAIYRELL
ncbi:MAG TPA: glycosyltransferase, partial [Bryobacteraceae bacterium]|nr:glycosyltransferase [Bryobacteraceae bacterium]